MSPGPDVGLKREARDILLDLREKAQQIMGYEVSAAILETEPKNLGFL